MTNISNSLDNLKVVNGEPAAIKSAESPEEFLSQIIRPSPFTAIVLIIPDEFESLLPPIQNWIPSLMQHSVRATLWDQASLISKERIPRTQIQLQFPVPVRINNGTTNLNLLPTQPDWVTFFHRPHEDRISLLRHIMRSLTTSSEVWITINSKELDVYASVIHASDSVCIAVPDHPQAMLKCYELIKRIHLSGYFSPIGLLDFQFYVPHQLPSLSDKLITIAKQFLALDLVSAGVVLSDSSYHSHENHQGLRERIAQIGKASRVESCSRDFLFCLSEGLIYQILGIV